MMNILSLFIGLLGALGLYLFGLKMLKTTVQKEGANKLQSLAFKMSNNRFKAIFTGIIMSLTLQSSMAAIQVVLNILNNEKISLKQGIGILIGMPLGTALVAWFIVFSEYNHKLEMLALGLIAVFFPFILAKAKKRHLFSDFIYSLSILYLSLFFLNNIAHEGLLQINFLFPEKFEYWMLIPALVLGAVLSFVFQSPIAVWLLSFSLLINNSGHIHWILAMLLGENIAGMVTARIFVSKTNRTSKRAALAYSLYFGVSLLWMLPLITPSVSWVSSLLFYLNPEMSMENAFFQPRVLITTFTGFMIVQSLLFWWTIPLLERIGFHLIPMKTGNKNISKLKYIKSELQKDATEAIEDARKEMALYARRVAKMFSLVMNLYHQNDNNAVYNIYERITKYDKIIDRMELELADYLSRYVTENASKQVLAILENMLKAVADLESIGDASLVMAKKIEKKYAAKIAFRTEVEEELLRMFDMVQQSLAIMYANIDDYGQFSHQNSVVLCKDISLMKTSLKKDQISNLQTKKYAYQETSIYNDLLAEAEEMGHYVMDVVEAFHTIDYGLETEESISKSQNEDI